MKGEEHHHLKLEDSVVTFIISLGRNNIIRMLHVCCLSISYFVYLVSANPDIGDIDGKKVVVNKVFIWL